MTLQADLVSIASFKVGASADYPVLKIVADEGEVHGIDGLAGEPMMRRTWTFESVAIAGANNQVAALKETLRTTLARRGQAVTFTELSGTVRTLPAGGGSAGSKVGYPLVSLRIKQSVGTWVPFEVTIATMVPAPQAVLSGFNLVYHNYKVSKNTTAGLTTLTQSGEVKVRNDQLAETYINNLIFALAESAAEAANEKFQTSIEHGPDTSECRYSYTRTPKGDTPFDGEGIDEVEVNDRTVNESQGRITRTISGYATGLSAAAFAAAQAPSIGANEILVRSQVSQPRVPDGRVDFSYEVRKGRTVAGFTGIKIYSYNETIEPVAGGRSLVESRYHDDDPLMYWGERSAYRYRQQTTIEFTGPWSGANPALLMDDDYRAGIPIARKSGNAGIRTITITQDFAFPTEQTLPDPFEVPPL